MATAVAVAVTTAGAEAIVTAITTTYDTSSSTVTTTTTAIAAISTGTTTSIIPQFAIGGCPGSRPASYRAPITPIRHESGGLVSVPTRPG